MKRFAWALALLASAGVADADEPRFDPLTPEELGRIVSLLVDSGRTDAATRLTRVGLLPGPKSAPPVRRAEVVALLQGVPTRIVVDLDRDTLGFTPIASGQAPITSTDWALANDILKASPAWKGALARRGIDDLDTVFCESLSPGHFPGTPSAAQRVIRLPCYEISDATTNIYGRPIEGLVATVDIAAGKLVDILDEGAQPLPAPATQLPLAVDQPIEPEGRIAVNGRRIGYGPWSLHAAQDDRFGLIVSDVRFEHQGQAREILHNGHVSEIFVPYMDPTASWAFRTYLDAGEFGLGTLASSLVPGVDCPARAVFLDSDHLSPTARLIEKPRTICAFLAPLPGPLWRHDEALTDLTAGATDKALVLRAIASVAHYDYVFDWVFGPTGDIEIRIGATGIDAVKGSNGQGNRPEGNRVTDDLIAVFHDHFFSVRLDVDIDGPANTLERQTIVLNDDRQNPLRRSHWSLDRASITREGALHPKSEGLWRIVSRAADDHFGAGTGYQLVPQGTVSVLDPKDSPQARAAFSAAPLWITAYDPGERAAAGDFPNQHPGGAGLPAFSRSDIDADTDIVLWPTIGFRHVTRPEDWPVLSTVWKSIKLRPYGFFARNPSFD